MLSNTHPTPPPQNISADWLTNVVNSVTKSLSWFESPEFASLAGPLCRKQPVSEDFAFHSHVDSGLPSIPGPHKMACFTLRTAHLTDTFQVLHFLQGPSVLPGHRINPGERNVAPSSASQHAILLHTLCVCVRTCACLWCTCVWVHVY